jgi:hypothetical protein
VSDRSSALDGIAHVDAQIAAERGRRSARAASSRRRSSAKSLHTAIEARAGSGRSMRANQPMKSVTCRRGRRFVRRKFGSSCRKNRASGATRPAAVAASRPAGRVER